MGLETQLRVLSEVRAVLALHGRLDAVAAPALKTRLRALVEEGRTELVCDLTGVDFIDSSGQSALVFGLEAARKHGGFLRLAGARPQAAESLAVTRLDHVFELYPGVEAALRGA